MSNYSQTTFFTPKDSLPSGNPAKIIYGAAYDVEFGNISTAIASKVDTASAASLLNVTVTSNTLPVNGIYLPAANTLGFSTNTTLRGQFGPTGGFVVGTPTGGDEGAGSINAQSIFINGTNTQPVIKVKAATTNRVTTTTLVNDPDLTYAIPVAGTYLIEVIGQFASGPGGFTVNLNYSGTINNGSQEDLMVQTGNQSAAIYSLVTVSSTVNNVQITVSGANGGLVRCRTVLVAGTTGTIALAWAQATSNAGNTSMAIGSTMLITRIA